MSTAIVNHWKSSVEWLKFCVNVWYPYIKLLHEQLLKGLLNSILIFDCFLSQFRPLDCTIVFHWLLCLSQNSYIQMSINHCKMEKWKFKQDHMVELVPGFLAFLNEEVSRKEQICMLTKKNKKRRCSGKEIAVSLKTTVWPCTGPLLVSVDSEPGTPRVVWIGLTKRFSYLRSSRLSKLIVSKCEIVGKPSGPFAYYHCCSGKRQLIVNYLQPGRDVIDYITFGDRIVKLRCKYTKMK